MPRLLPFALCAILVAATAAFAQQSPPKDAEVGAFALSAVTTWITYEGPGDAMDYSDRVAKVVVKEAAAEMVQEHFRGIGGATNSQVSGNTEPKVEQAGPDAWAARFEVYQSWISNGRERTRKLDVRANVVRTADGLRLRSVVAK
jgi:hypothetical protein